MSLERWVDQVRMAAVARGLHPRTRAAYVRWAARFLRECGAPSLQRPGEGAALQRYLRRLSEDGRAPATVRQARSALVFLHQVVFGVEVGTTLAVPSWRPSPAMPVAVVHQVLAQLPSEPWLMAALVYGAGLRVGECCRLRIRDVALERGVLRVRRADGRQDRLTVIPASVRDALAARVTAIRRQQLRRGTLATAPHSVAMESLDGGAVSGYWRWMWLFPSARLHRHPVSGQAVVRPLHATTLQRALAKAACAAGIPPEVGPVTCQRLRHSFAAQLLAAGYPIGAVQAVLGHRDRATTLRYHDALPVGWLGVRSPLDFGVPVPLPLASSEGSVARP